MKKNMKMKKKKAKRRKRKNREKGTLKETDTRYCCTKTSPKKINKYVLLQLQSILEGLKCIFVQSPPAPYMSKVVT